MLDPDDLRNLAADMRAVGRETSGDAAVLRSYGSMFRDWLSPAAEHFNSHQFEGTFSQLDLVERDAEDLAKIFDDLAVQLADQLARIRRTAGNIRNFFDYPPAWACATEEDERFVWDRIPWRYKPWNMPKNDSPEWLVVGNHFRSVYGVDV